MKKNWAKSLLGIFSILTLAACGANDTAGANNGDTASTTIAEIQEKGELVVATSADYPPYEWHLVKGGKDTVVGFDIDIAQNIADELGVELVINDMDFNGLIPAVSTGKADLVIAGMNPTPERAENVDFTDVYVTTKDVVLIRKEDQEKYTSKETLKDLKWATQKATIQEEFLIENYPDSYLQSVGKWGAAILSLTTGKVDGILMVETVANQYAKSNEDLAVAEIDLGSEPNQAAIAVQKGNEDFLETVNGLLNKMQEDGTVEQLIEKNVQLMEESNTN
ncbi:transporter substrate-binding domain-containing protein [Desemzia sp. RIT804]|uniref:transporter substrate-binding domain-containing protein n=1 Tax=Desemzia sp. RIT 804 TaxID=2810209 RepID=UPI001950601B|nr:transporter substrate-binding domain-containing protein [Desemzia sp. RIT 804]MBM6615145.1 transporter substrate-binding domain-containing protein [Desemzia sp. RIT 804]